MTEPAPAAPAQTDAPPSAETERELAHVASAERAYDLVLFGATGFTGGLTAEYLAAHGPDGLRWALAGRNLAKLKRVRSRLAGGSGETAAGSAEPGKRSVRLAELPLIEADIDDPGSMRTIAEAARVVITTVGPYINYGEPLVAACAAAGTDYVDLTGEPEFVDLMWLHHQAAALASGARIVHSCGFDSVPHDLGALYTVQRLPEGVPIHLEGFVRAGGTISGGTYHTFVESLGRMRSVMRVGRERRRQERADSDEGQDAIAGAYGVPTNSPSGARHVHSAPGASSGARHVHGAPGTPHRDSTAGGWIIPFPTIDPRTVLRSAAALDRYGPDFSYSHYLVVKRLRVAAALVAGAAGVVALAQVPATRSLLLRLRDPGEGPSTEQRARAWFKVRMLGEGGGERCVIDVSGGDPGYGETAKMLAESALCLAFDELPPLAGQLTPAVAMGQRLIDRLTRAGIRFDVVS